MNLEGDHFTLEEGEMIRIIGKDESWIVGPTEGDLSVNQGSLYANIANKSYELNASSVEDFPNLVQTDPFLFMRSDKGKDQDSGQDSTPYAQQ